MRKSEVFAEARRQSQWAIVFIILRFVRRLVSQLWPILIALFLGRGGGGTWERYEAIASFFGVFGMVVSVIAYFRYYYRVSDTELVIRKGILKKTKLNIPFGRIQSINFRQTLLHRLLQVTELRLETAGSTGEETKIDALSIPLANDLRSLLLAKKKEALGESIHSSTPGIDSTIEEHEETILRLSNQDLLRVGLTRNHLVPVGVVMGLMFSASIYAASFGYEPWELIQRGFDLREEATMTQLLLAGTLIIVLTLLASLARTFLNYYDLHFYRSGERFQSIQGLLTKKEFAANDRKVQILNWGQNPFEKMLGLIDIRFRQAQSGDDQNKSMRLDIPGCDDERLSFVQTAWLGYTPKLAEEKHRISISYFYHFAKYVIPLGLIIIGLVIYFGAPGAWVPPSIVLILLVSGRWISFKKKKYLWTDRELYVGGGLIGHRHALLPLYKIQNLSIVQSPYQWRRGLSTLLVYTASGTIHVPYIAIEKATQMLDQFTFKVETSRRAWM
ncbi:MAG: PH domain-containing protein [Bacteroidota bacterium]